MTEYVLCVVRTPDGVLLVRKARPEWQRGKLNFPGGRIEPSEGPTEAAVRETYEETGVELDPLKWDHAATITSSLARVYALRAETGTSVEISNKGRSEPAIVVPTSEVYALAWKGECVADVPAILSLTLPHLETLWPYLLETESTDAREPHVRL